MLITAFVQFQPKGHREPCNDVGSLSPAEQLVEFELESCYVWAGAPSCFLELLEKPQKRIWRTVALHLLPLLNPWLIVKMLPAYVFSTGITLIDVDLN